ncbi:MAG: 3'-5' exonuclease [Lachnospiraceae bacterium]|nr:3'-5' exonuclease [Lachnospiraceae bacterium]
MELLHRTDSYICIDLETTGLNPKLDKIIEIGAVRVEAGKVTGTFESPVNPGRPLEERIVELTGLTDKELRTAPDITEILPVVMEFLGESVLLGHSVLFDYSFLKKAAVNQKILFERKGIDTLRIARRYLTALESRSLDFLCSYYKIPHRAHRALEDAKATCALYDKLWEDFHGEEDAEKIFAPVSLNYQVKRESPITPAQKERLYKLLVRHKLITDYDLSRLTKNEASRYTDLILAKYGR